MNGRHRRRVVAGLLVLLTVQVGLVSPASAAMPGLEIAPPATSASNSSEFKSATASCPAGKVVVGTGARINGGGGDVVLDEVFPREGSVFVGRSEERRVGEEGRAGRSGA